jgi:hypothetical protein
VSKAGSDADATLSSTVNSLISYIGGPQSDPLSGTAVTGGRPGTAPKDTTGCTVTTPSGGTSTTLYGQLQDVQQLITAISTGSQACIAGARSELLTTIGDDTTTACPAPDAQGNAGVDAPDETIVCDIAGSAANLDTATGSTGADLGALTGTVTASQQAFSNLGTAVSSLDSDLAALFGSDTGGTSAGSGGGLGADAAILNSLSGDLTAAATAATTAKAALDSDSTIASAQEQEIGTIASNGTSTAAGTTIAGQVTSTADTACGLITGPAIDDPTQVAQLTQDDLVSLLLTNQHCAALSGSSDPLALPIEAAATTRYGTDAGSSSVTLKLLSEYAAWATVATNSAASTGLGTAIDSLDADVAPGGPLQTVIAALSPTGADGSRLADADRIISLLAAGGSNTACSALTATNTVPSVAEFSSACLGTSGTPEAGSFAAISQALKGDTGTLGDSGSGLAAAGSDAADAVSSSDTMLLQTTANGQITQDLGSLMTQQRTLMQQEAGTSAQLDKQTSAAVAALDASVGGADKSQLAAGSSLVSLVDQVKLDLGSGSAGAHLGILGAIQSNSAETGIGAGEIDRAMSQADAFKGVRQTAVADNLLTQQELQASLTLAQSMAPFGPALPAGSTHTTVYVFHLAAVG